MDIEEAILHAIKTSKNMNECKLCRDEHEELAAWLSELKKLREILGDNYDLTRLRHLVEADRDGRCVVLPVPMHRTLLDTSDPIRPELLKNFRISATWDHCGIVFHSPWNIFLENIEKGYVRILNEAAEAALKGEQASCEWPHKKEE